MLMSYQCKASPLNLASSCSCHVVPRFAAPAFTKYVRPISWLTGEYWKSQRKQFSHSILTLSNILRIEDFTDRWALLDKLYVSLNHKVHTEAVGDGVNASSTLRTIGDTTVYPCITFLKVLTNMTPMLWKNYLCYCIPEPWHLHQASVWIW